MDDYSIQSVDDSAVASTLPYPSIASVVGAAAAAIDEIVNASESAAEFNGSDLLQSVMRTTMRTPMAYREEIPWSISLLFLVIAVSVIIVGVAGNAFVVAVIFTDRKLLHSSVNLFLLNLALADMANLIFCAPDAVLVILEQPWVLPDAMCPMFRFLQQYFLFASVLLQMSIGVERFMAICSPLQMQRFSRRTTVFFLLCAWMLAALFAMPNAVYQRSRSYSGKFVCVPNIPNMLKNVIEVVYFAILYCIPLVLLTVLYFIMCRRLWGKECMIAGETQQMAILRLRRSVVKMLVISMLIYFICYTPVQSLGFLHLRPPHWVRLIMNIMVISSSAANPIVYIMCCRHFHQRFVSMVNRTIHCCPRTPEKYQTVITDADKYARMSVVTHSSSSRRHRKVKQRERTTDVSLSIRLLPQIDSAPEVDDSLGDTALMVTDYGRSRVAVTSPASAESPTSPSRHARASTTSATSYNWAASRDSAKFRNFRCTNPKRSTEMISVD